MKNSKSSGEDSSAVEISSAVTEAEMSDILAEGERRPEDFIAPPKRPRNIYCPLCGHAVDPFDPTLWKQVTGWVGGPKKDHMKLREDTGKFAHDTCVQKLSQGQAPDQPSMFELTDDPGEITKLTGPRSVSSPGEAQLPEEL